MVEKNIWGKSGCKLPSGKLCDACCQFYEVAVGNQIKPGNTPCPYQNSVLNHGEGCSQHGVYRECVIFHCPTYNPNTNLELIAIALSKGLVTSRETEKAIRQFARTISQENMVYIALRFTLKRSGEFKATVGQPRFK